MSRSLILDFLSHSQLFSFFLIVYRYSTCLKNESDCINTRRPFIHRRWLSSAVTPTVTDHNICSNTKRSKIDCNRTRFCLRRAQQEEEEKKKNLALSHWVRISINISLLLLLQISYMLHVLLLFSSSSFFFFLLKYLL